MLAKAEKAEVMNNIRGKTKLAGEDTGSPEVQVAILTQRINELTQHFKAHPKDEHSRYGLKILVNKRRSLLQYLRRISLNRYLKLIEILGLRH